ncbi:glycosyltransferase [Algoriphagus sp. H41]|uniref:Glycosyltransferase n=1 Tax=Algoriphagus oliviformis TaxID=2811231 RepID=A0ABS3CBD7_9BACT|nr:glycosyltransferase [Algoriphagus oliviformis]MBN7812949.1 glycosyltransferase [Algoriphagus oliviformis]
MSLEKSRLTLVVPQHNDWECAQVLLDQINELADRFSVDKISVVLVDDFSDQINGLIELDWDRLDIKIIRLVQNLGHQRAIAIGLCYAYDHYDGDWIGVMDADGEDRPEDLFKLWNQAKKQSASVFAHRNKRSEGMLFKLFYWLYKFVFWICSGKRISFGNFSVIRGDRLKALVHDPNLWNNYPAAFLKSKIGYSTLSTSRGVRYHGYSKMNLTSLVIHGLSGVAVFADVVNTRMIIFSLAIILSALLGISIVVSIKILTDSAIPGWATYSVLAFAILLFQALIIAFFTLFIFLSNRSVMAVQPVKAYVNYID